MANIVNIKLTDTFEQWRGKDNEIGAALGDLDKLNFANVAGDESVISALNELRDDTIRHNSWIGNISSLYDDNTNLTTAVNDNNQRLNTKDIEQGDITTLLDYTVYPSLVLSLNYLDDQMDNAKLAIGDMVLYNPTMTNLTQGVNEVHNDLLAVADNVGVNITQSFSGLYGGAQTSLVAAMNNDYDRLNKISGIIGGTQTDGTTIDFAAADLYGTHTNLVDAINGIEDFVLTNSKWDGTDDKSLIWALNNHESRLDTEENNIDLLQGDVGTWANYTGTAADITSALEEVKGRQDNLTSDFVNASGDTMSGKLVANGGIGATTSLTLGVGAGTAVTVNDQQRLGIGVAPHSSYKVDVNGTLNATDIKIGGESLDGRFLEVNTVSDWDEVDAQVEFNNNATFSDEVKMGTEVIYNSGLTFTEKVQDVSGSMFTSNSESGGISAVYSDATGKVTLAIADDGHNHTTSNIDNFTENVQDIVGTMVANPNTEAGIGVSYDGDAGKLNFNVIDPTISITGAVTGSATMTNLGSITINTASGSNTIPAGSITDLLEYIQDTVGAMVTGNTETGINVTYNDTNGKVNFDNQLEIFDVNGTQVF